MCENKTRFLSQHAATFLNPRFFLFFFVVFFNFIFQQKSACGQLMCGLQAIKNIDAIFYLKYKTTKM